MKKFRLSVLAMALTTMLGFTSCLDNDNTEYPNYASEIVRLNNYMGYHTFTTQYGVTLNPLNVSQVTSWPSTPFTYIEYSYEPEELDSMRWDVTLMTLGQINDGQVISRTPAEGDANAPVSTIALVSGGSANTTPFYQLNDMFLMVGFYCREVGSDREDAIAELDAHKFNLYYDPSTDFTASSMTLYLRHYVTDIKDDDKFNASTRAWQHFNMQAALEDYKQAYNKEPERIIISCEQNSTNGDYTGNISNRTFEFSYTESVKLYKSWLNSK